MNLNKLNKGELIALANTHDIEFDDDWKKSDFIEALADVEFDENDEQTDYAAEADFREWWSTATKEERNAYQAEQAQATE